MERRPGLFLLKGQVLFSHGHGPHRSPVVRLAHSPYLSCLAGCLFGCLPALTYSGPSVSAAQAPPDPQTQATGVYENWPLSAPARSQLTRHETTHNLPTLPCHKSGNPFKTFSSPSAPSQMVPKPPFSSVCLNAFLFPCHSPLP